MSTFKKVKVVMLPTNQKTNGMICKDITGQDKTIAIKTKYLMEHEDYIGHHLYIISDDEIKLFDCIYNNKENIVEQINSKTQLIFVLEENKENQTFKKIIATTDKTLSQTSRTEIPQPSQQFIQKFVEEYNKGNVITDVLVEYELISNEEYFLNTINPDDDVPYFDEDLKINPKDNTITIKKAKDSWTREEILNDIEQAIIQRLDIGQYRDKWIEENL